jgi:GT2 family glycosyltransferase
MSKDPQVTLVVVPRERFSCTVESLESIYEHTQLPFNLVYVDGNSPPKIQRYLQAQAHTRPFQLIRTNTFLYPNQARNLGLAQVKTPYVVFIDNDVIVSPGWLNALVNCAEETGATVVGPLMCQDKPLHQTIHFAGGEAHIWTDQAGNRRLREKMYQQGQRVMEQRDRLQRQPTELAEFHCVLVRTEIFERLGGLDEAMLNTKEHLDFCMTVAQAGGSIYFEPASLVTYVQPSSLDWNDLHYYKLRWSDAWTLASLNHLRQKWNLAEDAYFQTKYKHLGWRRKTMIIKPLIRYLTFGLGRGGRLLEPMLVSIDRWFDRYLCDRHAKRQERIANQVPPTGIGL